MTSAQSAAGVIQNMAATLRFFRFVRVLPKFPLISPRRLSSGCYPGSAVYPDYQPRWLAQKRFSSTQSETASVSENESSSSREVEKPKGTSDKIEFQAETRMLLDIVAKSLYSEKEVFLRELISNASDALEKLRYEVIAEAGAPPNLEIKISTDKLNRLLVIQDTGIGMTREELINNLGTIARSGSKAFLEQLKNKGGDATPIIGQFGVGFYSAFMVADKVEVYTRSYKPGSPGLRWLSDGSGTYEIQEADDVQVGTKIIITLKIDSREYSDEENVRSIIKKYSNFISCPILLNGERANNIEPLWLMDPKDVKPEMHDEFFRFVSNTFDRPRFTLHYKTDAPISIRALLYFPESKPGLFEVSRDADVGVALYTRRVLIKSKAENILPKWLRFVKGVVDSEDIPLNLSRELLQNSSLIRKLRTVLTNRILRFLHDRSVKETNEFSQFYRDYGLFLKEGIITSHEQIEKEEISKLLRFESSAQKSGESVSLPQYCSRVKEGQRDIYYLAAPSRELAEGSPYLEALRKKDVEVLFCYETYDELVLMQLRQFDGKNIISVEKEMRLDKESDNVSEYGEGSLTQSQVDDLVPWVKKTLGYRAHNVRVTGRLETHPCVVSVEEMAAARHFIRTQAHNMTEEARYSLLQPQLELNARHPIVKKLCTLVSTNPKLAELVTHQLFSNAMVAAGLMEDPRTLVTSMNELLTLALEKH